MVTLSSQSWKRTWWINKWQQKKEGKRLSGRDEWRASGQIWLQWRSCRERKAFVFKAKSCLLKKTCVCEKVWKKSGACDYQTEAGPGRAGPGRAGQGGLQTDSERDVYLELQSSRLWGGVRYCSRAWQGQEGTQEGEETGGRQVRGEQGPRLPLRSWGAPPCVGAREYGGSGGGRVSIGRFSWGADAQYADV